MLNRRFGFLLTVAVLASSATGCLVVAGTGTEPYESCTSGTSCRGISICRQANVALSGQSPGFLCTDSCSNPGATCPADPSGQSTFCVEVGGLGRCYRACGPGNSCPSGQTCGMPAGTSVQICIPGSAPTCGAQGGSCCAGNVCNTGLACSNGTCVAPPGAYEGCAGSSVNAACGDNTTCQIPLTANPGPNGWCTRACTGTMAMCPNSPIVGRSYNCYVLQGASGGQCYVDCPTGTEPCPRGTTCLMTNTMTASGVRICMPPLT